MKLQLVDWFLDVKRDFPWRKNPTPYAVWVSEIMLQQTRAGVVIPYFTRWMGKFPDIQSLARAEISDVMKTWEGLGYYRRAKNLHQGALFIVENHGGLLPHSKEALLKIPGIGRYTAGAILSFAFSQKAPAIDGNVLRVLSRYFLIEENIDQEKTKKQIELKAEEFLGDEKPWVVAEALIELGALVCLPKPNCPECPLNRSCKALKAGKTEELPIKNPKEKPIALKRAVFVFKREGKILVRQVEEGKVMGGLYEFPYVEFDFFRNVKALYKSKRKLPIQKHTFTKYKATLHPFLIELESHESIPFEGEWIEIKDLSTLPFSSGHRKIRETIV
jgi:A/G-specific adenine glycosylase